MEELINIQAELKAPKGQFNSFGKYKYRSCEDILEALKPLLFKYKCYINLTDNIEHIGERYYIKATAKLYNSNGQFVEVTAFAREENEKKGMDSAQITGAASSYARKYALNGLLAIDDSKDDDSINEGKITDGKINNAELQVLREAWKKTGLDNKVAREFWEFIGYEPSNLPKKYYDKILKAIVNKEIVDILIEKNKEFIND